MSFADKRTAAVFAGLHVRQLGADGAAETGTVASRGQDRSLAVPPGNRLEKLSGDRNGQWSIRINDQWRICFVWRDGNAWDVEIVDYH